MGLLRIMNVHFLPFHRAPYYSARDSLYRNAILSECMQVRVHCLLLSQSVSPEPSCSFEHGTHIILDNLLFLSLNCYYPNYPWSLFLYLTCFPFVSIKVNTRSTHNATEKSVLLQCSNRSTCNCTKTAATLGYLLVIMKLNCTVSYFHIIISIKTTNITSTS